MAGGVHIGARVPPDLAEAFAEVAAREERSISGALRQLMRQAIEAQNDVEPATTGSSVTSSAGREPINAT